MIDLIKKHIASYSESKWTDYQAALATDATYDEYATSMRVKGVDEYVKAVRRWKQAFPDLRATVLECFAAGDKVFAEVEWMGTHTGSFDGPFGMIPATNKRGTVKAAMVFTIKNNKIVAQHHYFDLLSVLAQMGIAAPLGGPQITSRPAALPREKH